MPERLARAGGGTAEGRQSAYQPGTAYEKHVGDQSSLTMKEVVCRENMLAACQHVVGDKEAPDADGMTVYELMPIPREC
ncbi:MAG: hypothetical protein JSU63_11810 [Phycisphaerales bacterium]|nr:MAG: hypothetical protein JSU63_11810 [Phycisphaerales bacterium]